MSWPQPQPNVFPLSLGGTNGSSNGSLGRELMIGNLMMAPLPGERLGRRVISPENEPGWVPLPGHKRNAPDNDIYLDRELGPAPAKQIAVDENYTDIVLAPSPDRVRCLSENEAPWNGEWKPLKQSDAGEGGLSISQNACSSMPMDEEMENMEEDFVPGAGANNCIDNLGDGKGKEKGLHDTRLHEERKMHVKNPFMDSTVGNESGDEGKKYRKLILFEGLRDLLSKKQSEDFCLPTSWIMDHLPRQPNPPMALVLYKQPQAIDPTSDETDESCARTTATNLTKNLSQRKLNVESEPSFKEEVMDLSV